ncbi:MAG: hypothetical protein OXG24_02100 [Gammaproteobacteria bacterium]|nr:hypothetical protein [Gammaproteobacteria bacterium]
MATLAETRNKFAFNSLRRRLFGGFLEAVQNFSNARCALVFLNGSYVTDDPNPSDYDACWNPIGVDRNRLDPILWSPEFRSQQKTRYGGEFFPSTSIVSGTNQTFLDFFQFERLTGERKGILQIDLETDPMLTWTSHDF